MRARSIGAILAMASAAFVMPAVAQSALDGPLAAPNAAPVPPQAPTAHAAPKPHKTHHAAAKPKKAPAARQDAAGSQDAPPSTPADAPAAHAGLPTDAFDYGMKWNGTSDGSAQTHYQNGLDGAFGSGAEVGMKLHF